MVSVEEGATVIVVITPWLEVTFEIPETEDSLAVVDDREVEVDEGEDSAEGTLGGLDRAAYVMAATTIIAATASAIATGLTLAPDFIFVSA